MAWSMCLYLANGLKHKSLPRQWLEAWVSTSPMAWSMSLYLTNGLKHTSLSIYICSWWFYLLWASPFQTISGQPCQIGVTDSEDIVNVRFSVMWHWWCWYVCTYNIMCMCAVMHVWNKCHVGQFVWQSGLNVMWQLVWHLRTECHVTISLTVRVEWHVTISMTIKGWMSCDN